MKRLLTASAAAIALLLAVGTSGAQGAVLPPSSVAWNYNFAPGSASVTADGNTSAGVTFTNEPNKVAVGSSIISATNLRVFSTATSAAPDVLNTNGAYSLTLQLSLNDNGTPYTGTLTFNGKLTGTVSAESTILDNVFAANKKQSVQLGSYNFEVEMIAFSPPGPPDQNNAGAISARVTVTSLAVADLPEPSTMLLSGLGLTFLGGAAWRKRRAKAVSV